MDKKSQTSYLHTRFSLLKRLQTNSHDQESWAEFHDCYYDFILSLLRRMYIGHHDCQDLAQKSLLKAWKNIENYDISSNKGKFRSWIATITNNTARSHYRKINSEKYQVQSGQDSLLQDTVDVTKEPEIHKVIEEEWEKHISNKAWEVIAPQLSEKVIVAFKRVLEGVAIADIAKELDITENTVYVYRQRVEKKLMKEIIRLDNELS